MSTPSFRQALGVFARIGLLSFGGPAAQIALMHRYLVDETGWLSERRFLNALSFCMLLPGPEAMQLATYAGWRLHGVRGGLAAGLLFVLPGAAVILLLGFLYGTYGALPLMQALFLGIKAAVLVIVLQALLKVARRALLSPRHWAVAAAAFVGLFFFALPFPLLVASAGVLGYLFFARDEDRLDAEPAPAATPIRTAAVWAAIWLVPLGLLIAALGAQHILSQIAVLFSQLAVVTFGGAYAVLAWLAEEAVIQRGWLDSTQMIDGLGLAETTPGPLILVTEFVAYLAALRESGTHWGALAGALVCLWATFAPCFLWIFVGAPYVERLDAMPRLRGALSAITAAVVGVILNLALYFALHTLFADVALVAHGPLRLWVPEIASMQYAVVGLTALAALLLAGLKLSVPLSLPLMMAAGWLVSTLL